MKGCMGNRNAGFSLIELMLVVSIIIILSSLFWNSTAIVKQREVEQYSRKLCTQIQMNRTLSMSKGGEWRLAMYKDRGEFYCVHEKKKKSLEQDYDWEAESEPLKLGRTETLTYQFPEHILDQDQAEMGNLILLWQWKFDKDTGACLKGKGTLNIIRGKKRKQITVYEESGRCEES